MKVTNENKKEVLTTVNSFFKEGMSLDTFEEMCEKEGLSVRVTECNGIGMAVTCDYRLDRINVSTKAPIVTEEIIDKSGKKFISQKVDREKQTVVSVGSLG